MFIVNHKQDTICAIITPNGVGAIGVIRISGNLAISIVNQHFRGKDLETQQTHTIHYGNFLGKNRQMIDEVVVALYKQPHSYTMEDVCEISCHGSTFIIQEILETLLLAGARMALPGEFTERAFLNGRFDLSQAEAVADLIASDSKAAHDLAMRQLKGGISKKLQELRTALIDFTALIELELDFAEEDVEFADRTKLTSLLIDILKEVDFLKNSFKYGNAIKEGIQVAIIGKPNAGKSTLLNALLQEDRAIVSSIAGTTRDTIEETFNIEGVLFRLIDTAGIRTTQDEIEAIGVKKAIEKINNAFIVIALFDLSGTPLEDIAELQKQIPDDKSILFIGNKQDAISSTDQLQLLSSLPANTLLISAKDNSGIDSLKSALVSMVNMGEQDQQQVIITNKRHHEALMHAGNALKDILAGMDNSISTELLTHDIKTALRHLGSITGHIDVDKDILATIFGKFCIGK